MIRLDDLTRPAASWLFENPVASGRADSLHEVLGAIREAERRSVDFREWVVVVVAYEAASVFDPAMRTAPCPPPGTPFVWWQSFAERTPAPPLVHGETRVVSRERQPGRIGFPDAVRVVRDRIAAGDVYQVNVTDRFVGSYVGTPLEMYSALVGVQRAAFAAYIEMDDRVVASASPELFFHWSGDTLTCRPMKGTAERKPRPAADAIAADDLRSSSKERAENVMIVDLLRNDLGRLARTGSVRVPELFALERYETVWQLTSTITAEVDESTQLTDVLGALFPCGSVTGAPKIAAMQIIDDLETTPRGVYCGTIGLLNPQGHQPRAVFSVPIRTAVLDPATSTYEYGAGGGITWSSTPEAEDEEVRSKARILTRSHRAMELLETLRNDNHGLRHVVDHLDRMERSADWFGIPFDRDHASEQLAAIPPIEGAERIRLLLSPDGRLTAERHVLDSAPDAVVLTIDNEVTRSDDPFCCHKTTWRRHYERARARHPSADDVVLVNELGHAIETTIANLAYRRAGRWYCPPLADGGLAGVARLHAIADGTLTERSISASELSECGELAVLNDLRGWRTAHLG